MSDVIDLKKITTVSEGLDAETAEDLAKNGPKNADYLGELRRGVRRSNLTSMVVSGACAIVALGSFFWIINRLDELSWVPPQVIMLDSETRVPMRATKAKDAPDLFSDYSSRFYLRELIERCEQYDYPTAQALSLQCAVLLDDRARIAYERSFDVNNPESMPRVYQYVGRVVAKNLVYFKQAESRHKHEVWVVTYDRHMTDKNQRTVCAPWRVHVTFTWRPELRMNEEQRSWNQLGFQVTKYVGEEDKTGRECGRVGR